MEQDGASAIPILQAQRSFKGHATVLQSQQGVEPYWGVPSPDGRHLAFSKTTFTENAWLLTNF
jgi:hypothetical protein